MAADREARRRLTPQTQNPSSLAPRALRRQTPKVGAGCGKAARTDLCGGTGATRFPTAITEMPPATGGFLRDREIYSDAQGDGGLATTEPGSRKVRSAPGPSE